MPDIIHTESGKSYPINVSARAAARLAELKAAKTDPPNFFCTECGIELDEADVTANLNTWGVFRCVCSDCIEFYEGDD